MYDLRLLSEAKEGLDGQGTAPFILGTFQIPIAMSPAVQIYFPLLDQTNPIPIQSVKTLQFLISSPFSSITLDKYAIRETKPYMLYSLIFR